MLHARTRRTLTARILLPLLALLACSQLPRRGRDVQLFDGHSLSGWHLIGEASYSVDDGSILARTSTGKANAFLVTDQSFGDFLLTLELKNEQPGNSGIQIRSRVVGDEPKSSYAAGYQIEIDPSPRAWSGGLYEERGRGWLQNLEHNEAGRKAFHSGEWNRYRIECIGPWIRASVNDVPTADALDPESLDGILGLQVHSGQDTRIRFRNLQLHVSGTHAWNTLDAHAFTTNGAKLGHDFGLRLTRTSSSPSLAGSRLLFRGEGESPNPGKSCSFPLDDPRLSSAKDKPDWTRLTILAHSDRVAIFRDHDLLLDSRDFNASNGPWIWIEKAKDAGEPLPFEKVEAIEQVN
jgi:hypothetical protein